MLLERVDGQAARRWVGQAAAALELAAPEINALNVFPVPDHDTGTNMALTLRSAAAAVEHATGGASEVTDAAAAGALAGACGSSGVILAAYLRGFATALHGRDAADGPALVAALAGASDSAFAAVSAPLEGTILSVARAAAEACAVLRAPETRSDDSAPVATMASAAAAGARVELTHTTAALPALAAAHVVDAGGRGLVVLLDALVDVTHGVSASVSAAIRAGTVATPRADTPPRFAYEVQYVLDAPVDALRALCDHLEQLGDSVVVVTGRHRHNVHVHVNDIGAAIEAALDVGRPSDIRVTHFGDQIAAGTD